MKNQAPPVIVPSDAVSQDLLANSDRFESPTQPIYRPGWSGVLATAGAFIGAGSLMLLIIGSFAVAITMGWCLSDAGNMPELYAPAIVCAAYFCVFGAYLPGRGAVHFAITITAAFVVVALAVAIMTQDVAGFVLATMLVSAIHFVGWVGLRILCATDRFISDETWLHRHLDANKCPFCLYNNTGLPGNRCPECGNSWGRSSDERS